MADIKLTRPAAGQNVVIPSAPDARMVLDFAADQVSIDRPQGSDSLFFRFDDGSSIELQNFYTQYNKDAIPSFEVDGQLIAGADFFNAFGPDLAPAAGPSASPTRSGRYRDFANAGLEHGVNHLDGLDYRLSFAGDTQPNINPYASPFLTNAAPTLSTGGAAIAIGLTERAWRGTGDNAAPDSQRGSFSVADPDGDSLTTTVSMGGKVVAVSTAGPTTVESDYGTLVITPRGGGSNVTFEYTYTLKQDPYSPTDSLAEGEKQADSIVFSISDGKGHTVTQPINVVITGSNDAPDITGVQNGTVKDDGAYGKHGDYDNGIIGDDERDPITASGTAAGEARLSVSGAITAIDPDHGDKLTFGFTDSNGNKIGMVGGHVEGIGAELGKAPDGSAITVTDVTETSDTLTIKTDYGTLALTTTGEHAGEYTFTLNNTSDATNALSERDSVTLTLHPTVSDLLEATDGSTSIRTGGSVGNLELSIKGSNDLPTVTSNSWASTHGEITEPVKNTSGEYKISGTIEGHDKDHGEAATLHYGFALNGKMESTLYVAPVFGTDGVQLMEGGHPKYELTTDLHGSTNYYGTLTISGSGASATYTFELSNSADCVQALDDSSSSGGTNWSSLPVTVPVVVMDKAGGYVQENIHLDIKGANDAPVFTIPSDTKANAHDVKEDGVFLAGERSAVLAAGENTTATNDANSSATDGLAGQSDIKPLHEFVVSGSVAATDVDGHGKSDTLAYSLVNEGGTQNGNSTIYVAVTYNDTTHTWNAPTYSTTAPADGAANYLGKLVMGADGHYTFTLANDGHGHATGAANALGEGESIPLTFTPAVSDGTAFNAGGAPSIVINVHGTNDAPKVDSATQTSLSYMEGTTAASETKYGVFAVSDADATDKITFGLLHQDGTTVSWGENGTEAVLYLIKGPSGPEVTNIPPIMDGSSATLNNYYGKIAINADAADSRSSHYSLEVYNNSSAINELNQGQKLPLTFTVVAGDQHGAYATQTIDTTITGTNDAPSFNGVYSKVYLRDDGVHDGNNPTHLEAGTKFDGYVFPSDHRIDVSNTLSTHVTDADKDATLRYSIDTKPTDGSFLKEGSTLTATSSAGNAVDVKIISVSDSTTTQTIETNVGTLTLTKATGAYTFALKTASAEVNSLAQGETITFSLRSVVTDEWNASDHHMLSIGIEGANDKPTLSLTPEQNYSDANHQYEQYEVKETANTNTNGSGSNPVYALGTAVDHDDDHNPTLTFGLALGVKQEDATGKIGAPTEETGKVSYTVTDGVVTMKGTYGTLSIDAHGKFSYTVDNGRDSNANKLAEGATGSDTFTILVKDEHGAWTAQPLTVQVTGVNDPPYLMGGNNVNVTESGVSTGNVGTDGIPAAPGQLNVGDPDSTLADKPYSIVGGTADADGWITKETDYGTLRLNSSSGAYEYTLNNSSASTNKLAAGATHTDKIAITVTDSAGKVLSTKICVTITGTNDRPTLDLGSPSVQVSEDGTLQFTGEFDASNASNANKAVNVTDVDAGDSHKFYLVQNSVGSRYAAADGSYTNSSDEKSFSTPEASGSITGTYGTLTMKADGTYTYTLNNNSPAVQGLTAADPATETFYVMVKDANGAFDIKPLTVKVTGQDDKVQLATTDVQIAQATESGVKFTAPGTDEVGSKATGKLAVVMPADVNAEGGANKIQFGFKITPADGGTVTYARPKSGEQGTTYDIKDCGKLTIDKDGNYSFELYNGSAKVEALNAGDKYLLTDLAGIKSIELAVWGASSHAENFCSTQTLEVTINGTNDKPYFTVETGGKLGKFDVSSILSSQTSTESLSEDSAKNSELHGKLTGDDVDAADTPKNLKFSLVETDSRGAVTGLPQVVEGKYGFLHLSEDGSYVYTLTDPSKLQSLNPGEICKDEVFTVRVRDALGAYTDKTLVIELTGEKDAPHISATNPAVKEAGYNDVGHDTATGNFSISVTDAQDAPLLGKPGSNVTYSYVQNTYEGKYGTLTVNADGSYSYKLNNSNADIDKLNVGDSATDSFTLAVTATADGAKVTQDVTINVGIAGTNDAPVLSGTEVEKGIVWKGVFIDVGGTFKHAFGSVVATGQVSGASDVDDSTSSYMLWNGSNTVGALQTEYGTITMNADGSYSYYLDTYSSKVAKALADAKAGGRPLVDTISYKAVDPHNAHSEQTKTIEIKISDIVPGFDVGDVGTYGLDRTHSTLETAIYEDNGDPTKTPGSATPPDGTLSAHGEVKGTWTGLGFIEWDSNHGFGIKGDGNIQVQSSAGKGEIAGRYGYIVIDPMTGKYTYTLFNDSSSVQALNQDDVVTETFTLMRNGEVVQENGKDVAITITIHGTNDNPVITTAQNKTITEDAAKTDGRFAAEVTGKLVATDVDADETKTLTWKVVGAGPQHGSVEISKDANGQWTYTYKASDSYKGTDLLSGQHATDKFTVQVSDENGGVTQKEITITFEGKNNVPTGTDAFIAIQEDTELTPTTSSWMGDLIKVQDDRGTANLSFTVSHSEDSAGGMVAKGTYGTLFLDGKGHYTYSLNNASDDVQALHAGKNVADTFYVTITDSEGGISAPVKVEVNITGTNDAPLLNLEKVLLLREGQTESDSGMASIIDKDAGDVLTYKVAFEGKEEFFEKGSDKNSATIQGKYGTLTLDADGKYTYELTSHALGEGEKADEKFTITVADESGATVSKDLTVSIVGANDAPVFTTTGALSNVATQTVNGVSTLVYTASVTEDGANGGSAFTAAAAATDVDANDSRTYSLSFKGVQGSAVTTEHGAISIDAAGNYTYTLNDSDAAVQALGEGQTLTETVKVTVTDHLGATSDKEIVVTIHGTNDAPDVATIAAVSLDVAGLVSHADVTADIPRPDAHDVDGDKLSYKVAGHGSTEVFNETGAVADIQGEFGTLRFDADAHDHFIYQLDTSETGLIKLAAAYADSTDGSTPHDTFAYTVTDTHLASNTSNITINLDHSPINTDGSIGDAHATSGHLLFGTSGNDNIWGGEGNDILSGGAGDDKLYGGDGNDYLFGGAGNDHLYGGAGSDSLTGGAGNDFLDGGAGNDVLVFHQGDKIDGGGDLDMVIVGDGGTVDTLLNGGVNGADSNVKNVEVLVSGDKAGDITSLTDLANKGLSLSTGEDGNIHVDASTAHNWSVATGSHTDASNNTFTTYTHTDSNGAVDLTVAVETLKNTNG